MSPARQSDGTPRSLEINNGWRRRSSELTVIPAVHHAIRGSANGFHLYANALAVVRL